MKKAYETNFYNDLKSYIQKLYKKPDFKDKWNHIIDKIDQEWINQTSEFNIDTFIFQEVNNEFPILHLFNDNLVHELFFNNSKEHGFSKILIGRQFTYTFPNGEKEEVTIENVFLGKRYGMGFKLLRNDGTTFEIEKFD